MLPSNNPSANVHDLILTMRGQKVILDMDLSRIYGVTTKRLNEQVKRNLERFPTDFMFRLNRTEVGEWNRSQIATGSQKHRDPRFSPYAFTEHGAIMAATVVNSSQAVRMSIFVVRAFVKMREYFGLNQAMGCRLAEIEKHLLAHDIALKDLLGKMRPLLIPPPELPKRKIGFTARETSRGYRA